MADIERTVVGLTRRIHALEDQLAVQSVIVRDGLAADAGDADGVAAVFTEDGVRCRRKPRISLAGKSFGRHSLARCRLTLSLIHI